jgi:hypothetical protein
MPRLIGLLLVILLSPSATAFAGAESVILVKVMKDDNKLIIQRRNGDQWMITKGVGALSTYRYEGRMVIINSPGIFCGAGSTLLLVDDGQEARIWDAEFLGSGGGAAPGPSVVMPVTAGEKVVAAMVLIGAHDPGSNVMTSFNRYQESKNLTVEPRFTPALYRSLIADLKAKARPTPLVRDLMELLELESRAGIKDAKFTTSRRPAVTSSGIIESNIEGEFKGWEGRTIIRLTNGQVWQQNDLQLYLYLAIMPKVMIISTSGGYMAKVEGVGMSVGVTRLR